MCRQVATVASHTKSQSATARCVSSPERLLPLTASAAGVQSSAAACTIVASHDAAGMLRRHVAAQLHPSAVHMFPFTYKCCANLCPRQTSMAGQARVLTFAAHPLYVTITLATHEVLHPAGISSALQGHGSMQQGPALLPPLCFSYSVLVLLRWRGCGCAALRALPRLQWALACLSMACGITAHTPWGRRHLYAPVAVACFLICWKHGCLLVQRLL